MRYFPNPLEGARTRCCLLESLLVRYHHFESNLVAVEESGVAALQDPDLAAFELFSGPRGNFMNYWYASLCGDLLGLFLQRLDIQAQVFLDDLSVFFPSFQESLREEIAMPVPQRELMLDMRRLLGVGNFARVAEYFNRLGGFVVLILTLSSPGAHRK